MAQRFVMPIVALLAVCGFAINAADSEIEQLKKMIQAQNAKIEKLEKAQGAAATTSMVDKAVGSKGAAYLAPDKPDIKGTGLSFTGEFLYWRPIQGGNEYATAFGHGHGPAAEYNDGGTKSADLDWEPAFRIGLAYQLPYEGWDIKASYTYFRGEGEDDFGTDDSGIVALLITDQEEPYDAYYARGTSKLGLDMVNFDLGRNTKVSESLTVRPFVGFQYAGIDSSLEGDYNFDDSEFDPDNNYWGKISSAADLFGIRVGADVDIKLKSGFSLFGQAAASLLTGSAESAWKDVDDAGDLLDDVRNDVRVIVPAVQIAAGFAWERKISDKLNFKASLGYEFNQFFGAVVNPLQDGNEDMTYGGTYRQDRRDLGLHGLTFRIKLDF